MKDNRTYKGFHHCLFNLIAAVSVNLLEELIKCSIALQFLIFLFLGNVLGQFVPVRGVMAGRGVLRFGLCP